MTSSSRITTLRSTLGALIAFATVTAVVACTAAGGSSDASSAPPPEATELTPTVTEAGAGLIDSIADCAQLAAGFGAITDGLELSLESLDETGVFCDWIAADDENHIVSIEVLGTAAEAVPTTEAVAASGGTLVASEAVSGAGGIAYSIAGADDSAYSVTAALPDYSISVTALGGATSEDQAQQIITGIESLIASPAG